MAGAITDTDGLGEIPTPNVHGSRAALIEELSKTRQALYSLRRYATSLLLAVESTESYKCYVVLLKESLKESEAL